MADVPWLEQGRGSVKRVPTSPRCAKLDACSSGRCFRMSKWASCPFSPGVSPSAASPLSPGAGEFWFCFVTCPFLRVFLALWVSCTWALLVFKANFGHSSLRCTVKLGCLMQGSNPSFLREKLRVLSSHWIVGHCPGDGIYGEILSQPFHLFQCGPPLVCQMHTSCSEFLGFFVLFSVCSCISGVFVGGGEPRNPLCHHLEPETAICFKFKLQCNYFPPLRFPSDHKKWPVLVFWIKFICDGPLLTWKKIAKNQNKIVYQLGITCVSRWEKIWEIASKTCKELICLRQQEAWK